MSEILFRAKIVGENEWVYGHYVHQYNSDMIYLPNGSDCYGFDYHHIDTNTLGQFTGLTDKNGKRIFEGDIVKTQLNAYLLKMIDYTVVSFDGGAFGLRWKRCGLSGGVEQFTAFTSICNTEYEVVGNIHDNPELLEVQDE